MAWNEPGGNRNDQDPWGGGGRGNDGPPDLDEAIKKGMEKLNRLLGGKSGGSGSGGSGGGGGSLVALIAVIVLAVLLAFESVYTLNERERAVVLRLGEYTETVGPGLHFKVPFIDEIRKADVTRVRTQVKRGHMLTEDENIVDIDLTTQYVIKDLQKFLLQIQDPIRTLDYAIDSALRHEVGSSEMDQVLTEGRQVLAINVQERLQRHLDFYDSGIEIRKVNINDAQPPKEVQNAFENVQRAKEDEQKVVNQAEAYRNKVIPEARGKAQRTIEEASAYKEQVVAQAEGDIQRFLKLLSIYETAPDVTRERMYIDTLQQVLSNTSKVMLDVEDGNNLMYLPLDKLSLPTMSGSSSGRSGSSSSSNNLSTDERMEIRQLLEEELKNWQNSSSRRGR